MSTLKRLEKTLSRVLNREATNDEKNILFFLHCPTIPDLARVHETVDEIFNAAKVAKIAELEERLATLKGPTVEKRGKK